MEIPFFNLSRQYEQIAGEINTAIGGVLSSGIYIGGEAAKQFEDDFAYFTGAKYCIGCANGTDALELALQGLGIGDNDEVIVPAFGWISPALAVQNVGATPVFGDISLSTYNLDRDHLAKLITSKTKAVIVIHLFGMPSVIIALAAFCDDHGLLLIEDCAQAHGAKVAGQHVGSFGKIGVFSFYPTKNLGAIGDAGCIVTNDQSLAHNIRSLANYGRSESEFSQQGRNSRLDPIQAAILTVKLAYLEKWNARRSAIANNYLAHLDTIKLILPEKHPGHIYHQFVVRSNRRNELRDQLAALGIGTMVHYPFAIPSQPAFGNNAGDDFPHSLLAAKQVLSLPIYPELTDDEVGYVISSVNSITESFK